jgi:hypothetical protein
MQEKRWRKIENYDIWYFVIMLFIFFLIGCCSVKPKIEIQEVVKGDNGYYITINDEIYYKEV